MGQSPSTPTITFGYSHDQSPQVRHTARTRPAAVSDWTHPAQYCKQSAGIVARSRRPRGAKPIGSGGDCFERGAKRAPLDGEGKSQSDMMPDIILLGDPGRDIPSSHHIA